MIETGRSISALVIITDCPKIEPDLLSKYNKYGEKRVIERNQKIENYFKMISWPSRLLKYRVSLTADDVSAPWELPTYLRTSGMLLSIAFYNWSYISSYLSGACNTFSLNEGRIFSPFQKRGKELFCPN